ncbi:excalibur calcium-binding domain-containing protein [Bifidobacterium tibiigranuli]|jgi:glucan-binding YG repeat protein|uniref:excalibur calcium-binding domain-containing protein n=1 Tax=Bifidobacterium tibiigranuli TaxID=2172043 RepID=UPI001F33A88C|nr:excalibur calcium-binding domain-containing protein [Bifidobacterium tibiigranuli]MCI1649333.1 excalibur calcium-binding domain-containing protein [Bifidobacterium tibiigranuli]MCI1674354.1 excalibur calcium-binding domain-containing protein [Bifidobacterium tibiigranuli]MCI1713286.1 excalibur calcium-binding domain-containing protein [Bifidobacterium tibiigranuli]MCI2184663.1 excalibur calcium-binding domain-containing protein [Bifidobacterium tibiigranuli]MCI2204723.1 excalibur calcium-bi
MIHHKYSSLIVAACLALTTMTCIPSAFAEGNAEASVECSQQPEYTGWVHSDSLSARRWCEQGTVASSKEFFDPGSNAWYWADSDGSIAHDKDVYQWSNGGKWVRYDHNGYMVKGENYKNGGWYFFDLTTGAMFKGIHYVGVNGGKWVYYDWTTGKMAHGEQFVNYDAAHTGWYLFDTYTGAMFHGDTFVRSNGGKWVRYDSVTGKMVHGLQRQGNAYYYFDQNTGKMAHGRTYVPEWNGWFWFDQTTGQYIPQSSQPAKPAQPSGTYYANCTAVRRAGKAPLHRGDPGYRPELDRDKDGLACE